MKKLLIVQPQEHFTSENISCLREDIMMCYENNKPIVLPKNVKYEVIELSEIPLPMQVDYTKILDDINKVSGE